jgi:hypothetical protein
VCHDKEKRHKSTDFDCTILPILKILEYLNCVILKSLKWSYGRSCKYTVTRTERLDRGLQLAGTQRAKVFVRTAPPLQHVLAADAILKKKPAKQLAVRRINWLL